MRVIKLYEDSRGKIPVKDFIDSLPPKARVKTMTLIQSLKERGHKLSPPHAEKLTGEDFWELRIKWSSNSYRIFYFFFQQNDIYLLHGFSKRTRHTPRSELAKARKRMDEVKKRGV